MFSSHQHLKRKTPEGGIDRREYIEHLVEEYFTTTDVEAQEQVSANLANFAYDPINWNYLRETEALQLFVELLDASNDRLKLHGLAGLCNICLDPESKEYITSDKSLRRAVAAFLTADNKELVAQFLTFFYQLLSSASPECTEVKKLLVCPDLLKRVLQLQQDHKEDKRIANLCTVFLEDFGRKSELTVIPPRNASVRPAVEAPLQHSE